MNIEATHTSESGTPLLAGARGGEGRWRPTEIGVVVLLLLLVVTVGILAQQASRLRPRAEELQRVVADGLEG